MESILRTAARVLGDDLSDPVDLGGSRRSTVVRCRTATGGSMVVKAFTAGPESVRAFVSEAAGLSLGLAGPRLLGVAEEFPLLVMEDLGEAPSLADVLLGGDPKAAGEGMLAWARGLGRLGAASVERRADLARLRARFGTDIDDESWIVRSVSRLPALLDEAGVPAPAGLDRDLRRVTAVDGEEFTAFTPGDTCPDNSLLTARGLRLIDFEAACFQPVFLTAAYCRMPFSTCWCVFTLPAGVADGVEQAYRAEVSAVYPPLADDAVWRAGLSRAIAAWTVHATVHLWPIAVVADRPMHRTRRPVPSARQLLMHRWANAGILAELPAFATAMDLLRRRLSVTWAVAPLPAYPAFRDGGGAAPA